MALYDNKYWLLSHIRNSFISTDDTGMCELVMMGESKLVKEKILSKEPYPDPDLSEESDDPDSDDMHPDFEFGFRGRTNTAAQLDKLAQARRKAANVRHIKWESKANSSSNNDSSDLFIMKEPESKQDKPKSGLTELLKQYTNVPINPYIEFAKFDGSGQLNIPTRTYRIFLTMLPEDQRNYPLEVCCVATATIQELIGLILLKYSTQYGDVEVKPVTNYGLYITEDDGEIDRDFPSLDPTVCVAKCGFTCLGLIEQKESTKSVSFGSDTPKSDSSEGKKRTTSSSKADENRQIRNDLMLMDIHNRAMEAPLYQSYRVFIVNKVRQRIEILLGVSGDKIEIDPVQQKSSKFPLGKMRAISHPMDSVACCEITDVKSTKTMFRVTYSTGCAGDAPFTGQGSSFSPPSQTSPSFKHYDFEADNATAEEIHQKINLILDLRSSISRKEYLAAREKKNLSKKKSFSVK